MPLDTITVPSILGDLSVLHRAHGYGEAVLMLHDLGGLGGDFDALLHEESIPSFEIFSPDLPGFGNSTKPSHCKYSVEDFAQSLVKLLEVSEKPMYWHVLGAGLGFLVGLQLALDFPNRVRSVHGIGLGSLRTGSHNDLLPVSKDEEGFASQELPIWISARKARKERVDGLQLSSSYGYFRAATSVSNCVKDGWVGRALEKVRCAVVLIHGVDDERDVRSWLVSSSKLEHRLMLSVKRSPLLEAPGYLETILDVSIGNRTALASGLRDY